MHFEEMKIEALRLANNNGGPPEEVVERAQGYLKFLLSTTGAYLSPHADTPRSNPESMLDPRQPQSRAGSSAHIPQ